MTILLAFPSSAMSFFLIFVLLELDSDLSTYISEGRRSPKIAFFWAAAPRGDEVL